MEGLEKAVADALRLSSAGAEKLLPTIQRNIRTARAELIRSGVPSTVAESDNILVENAIITFCLYQMDDEEDREKNFAAFQYQQDCIRKSSNEDPETEEAADEE